MGFHKSREYGVLIGEIFPLDRNRFASSEEYDVVIPKVKRAYSVLIEDVNKIGLRKALDKFLREVSQYALLDNSFISCLAEELNLSEKEVVKTIVSTSYFNELLDFLKHSFRKIKKEDAVKYAEGFGEIVSFLGLDRALDLLWKNGIKIGKSTLQALYNVSLMPTWLKKRIGKDIPLAVAYELPKYVDENLVEKISGLHYRDARRFLKEYRLLNKKKRSHNIYRVLSA